MENESVPEPPLDLSSSYVFAERRWVVVFLLGMSAIFIGWPLDAIIRSGDGNGYPLLMVGLFMGGLGWARARQRLVLAPSGLTVRNMFSRIHIEWYWVVDVDGIDGPSRQRKTRFFTSRNRNNGAIAVWWRDPSSPGNPTLCCPSTYRADPDKVAQLVRGFATAAGATMENIPDWKNLSNSRALKAVLGTLGAGLFLSCHGGWIQCMSVLRRGWSNCSRVIHDNLDQLDSG